jgi:Zn-dependent protease
MSFDLLLIRIPVILIALTVHEYAHGWVAYRCGDDTAHVAGRLTFNPLAHLDIFGTLMLMFGPFGWAKPVPVSPHKFNNRKRDTILVSIAGPVSNIILAFVFGYIFRLLPRFWQQSVTNGNIYIFLILSIHINLGLSFFNLLPVPPLDGSNIFLALIPRQHLAKYWNVIQKVPMVFFMLIVIQWALNIPVFSMVINPLWKPYFAFWQFAIFGSILF